MEQRGNGPETLLPRIAVQIGCQKMVGAGLGGEPIANRMDGIGGRRAGHSVKCDSIAFSAVYWILADLSAACTVMPRCLH